MTTKLMATTRLKRKLKQNLTNKQMLSTTLVNETDKLLNNIVSDISNNLNKQPYTIYQKEHFTIAADEWLGCKARHAELNEIVKTLEAMQASLTVLVEKYKETQEETDKD